MITSDIVKEVFKKNKDIKGIYYHSYPEALPLQERIEFDEIDQDLFYKSLQIRNSIKLPFWDSLMMAFVQNQIFSEKILDALSKSAVIRKKKFLSRKAVLDGKLEELQKSKLNYAINSEIILSTGEKRHLLLLDFHIRHSVYSELFVQKIIEKLYKKEGFIINSGKSYHFIGSGYFTLDSMLDILVKSIFFSPVVDKTWVAYQLLDRSCSLRFTKKHNSFPTLVKHISF